ncbi:MAG: 3-hydroxyanthranilate 3,4-dioxygenase [Bacteroidia bacterium]|nr:3-hydroxyanthranilate 3,4-dioxygenase [Bacteroidia bacterium]
MQNLRPIHFKSWIDEHRHLLRPPVGNKMIWPDGEFIVMVVGGPNRRKDFHINGTPEFFYQIEGDMTLRIRTQEGIQDIPIREGEIFLLPAGVPHSPQRNAGTVGLVVEQLRPTGMLDGLAWYCEKCGEKLYEEYFVLKSVEKDFPPVFERFFSDLSKRTCRACGSVMEK